MGDRTGRTDRLVGLKQSRKAIREGRAGRVYIAEDAEDRVRLPLIALCEECGVPYELLATMREIGAQGGIDVAASVMVELLPQADRI